LIEENPDNAQRFTTSSSKVYRYVLSKKRQRVGFRGRIGRQNIYEFIKMRFEDSLEYELKVVNPDPEAKVVPPRCSFY
jgi:LytS/YehU family sensor histidine kinase